MAMLQNYKPEHQFRSCENVDVAVWEYQAPINLSDHPPLSALMCNTDYEPDYNNLLNIIILTLLVIFMYENAELD